MLEVEVYDEFAAWVLADNPLPADFQSKVDRPIPLVVPTREGEVLLPPMSVADTRSWRIR
ncbi:hypothetical protein [Nocardia aurea]|uniref:Uncharacterized protein n=1 Tax=Nocardia aurea TaxID=2144174 RepID=A0ABV3FS48_9NOCA